MVVNDKKTVMLCMSDAISFQPEARMMAGNDTITSKDQMKVFGFVFGKQPTVNTHVELLIRRLRSRTWALTKLKRAGFSEAELVRLYCGAIRPVAEYATPAFHSMVPGHLAALLERQQSQALKHIFGSDMSAAAMRERASIPTLTSRRESATIKFAVKASKNPRFAAWFPQRPGQRRGRRSRPLWEPISRTDRARNSPLNFMRRKLNDIAESESPP